MGANKTKTRKSGQRGRNLFESKKNKSPGSKKQSLTGGFFGKNKENEKRSFFSKVVKKLNDIAKDSESKAKGKDGKGKDSKGKDGEGKDGKGKDGKGRDGKGKGRDGYGFGAGDGEDDDEDDPMIIIKKFLNEDCGNPFLKDLFFIFEDFNREIARDINRILMDLLPLVDAETVDIIIFFLKGFNKAFEDDPEFREQFNKILEHSVGTIVEAGENALGSVCQVIIKILGNSAQAIPGVGAVISVLKAANNIADTVNDLSETGSELSGALSKFSTDMSGMSNKILSKTGKASGPGSGPGKDAAKASGP